jgi:hypothetical protein
LPLLASTDAIRLVTNPNLTASAIASSEVGCCLVQSLWRHLDHGAIESLLYGDGGFHLHDARFGTKLLPKLILTRGSPGRNGPIQLKMVT